MPAIARAMPYFTLRHDTPLFFIIRLPLCVIFRQLPLTPLLFHALRFIASHYADLIIYYAPF